MGMLSPDVLQQLYNNGRSFFIRDEGKNTDTILVVKKDIELFTER